MGSGSGLLWQTGIELALEVMALLGDVVERIEVAGSLRRNKEVVGDIELVMTPRYLQQPALFSGLFTEAMIDPTTGEYYEGQAIATGVNLLDQRCEELLDEGVFQKRLNKNGHAIAWGKAGGENRYKAALYRNIPLDLFIVLPDRQWGPTYLVRTGPHDANGVLVTLEGVRNRDGNWGTLPFGFKFDAGAIWYQGNMLDTPTERDVFAALSLPYIPPHLRSVAMYQCWAGRRSIEADWRAQRPYSSLVGYEICDQDWRIEWQAAGQEAIPA